MYKYNTNESRIVEGIRVCCDTAKYSVYYSRPNIMKYWDYKRNFISPKVLNNNEEYIMACKCPKCNNRWYQFMPTDNDHINCYKCNEYGSYAYKEDKYNSLRQAACYYYLKMVIPDLESNYLASNGFHFDLYSKNLNLLIEIDSKEFHEYTESKDRENDKYAKESGITIARLNPQYNGDFDNINAYARSLNEEYFSYLDDRSCDVNDGVLMCLLYVRDKFNVDVSGLDIDCRRDLVKINENRNIFNIKELGDEYINKGTWSVMAKFGDFKYLFSSIVVVFHKKYGDDCDEMIVKYWEKYMKLLENTFKYELYSK